MALLVLVVDRDDDVGVKAGVETPVRGRDDVLRAGELLLLADPEDSDGNTIFMAVKIYDELVERGIDADVALVAGDPHVGLVADMKIRKQLERLFKEREYEGIVFVSDGAEDDQVIPIVSSFAPIVSKRTVIVKQAQQLEKTFYTLKTALSDPTFSRLLLGVPGVLLILWFLFQENALRLILGVLGAYLVIRGFGFEEPIINTLKTLFSFNPRSPSFPFQLISIAILLGGSFLALHDLTAGLSLYEVLRFEGLVIVASLFAFTVGKSLEALLNRQAYKIGDYLFFFATILVAFLVGDGLLNFLSGKSSLFVALMAAFVALAAYFILVTLALWIRNAPLESGNIVGAVLYDRTGIKLGRIKRLEKGFVVVERGKRRLRFPIERLRITDGRVVLA